MKNIFLKFVLFPTLAVICIFVAVLIGFAINNNTGLFIWNIFAYLIILAIIIFIIYETFYCIKNQEYIWLIPILFLPIIGGLAYHFHYKNRK